MTLVLFSFMWMHRQNSEPKHHMMTAPIEETTVSCCVDLYMETRITSQKCSCQDNFTKILCLTKQDHKQYHCILYCASIFIPPLNNKSCSAECMYLSDCILFAMKQWETNFRNTSFRYS